MKKIGITTRIITNEISLKQEKVPRSLIKVLEKHNILPILIPNIKDISYYLDLCDGFIIPGGNTWGETDIKVIKYALDKDKPLLGICAGMQAIANMDTFLDNTIKVDNHNEPNKQYVHEVIVCDGILKQIYNKDKILVNSRHTCKVEKKDFFKIEAISLDGVIEAISIPKYKFIVGVQWHPEDLDDINQDKLFTYFIDNLEQ